MADKGKENTSKLSELRKLIEDEYAKSYWCEDSLTKNGDIPREKAIEPLELFDMVVDAVRSELKAYSVMCEVIARINDLARYCVGDDIIRGKIVHQCEIALEHRDMSDGIVDAINSDMLRTYYDFVEAWNDYVRRSGNGSVSGFLSWLSSPAGKKRGEENA
jgi:ribosomal protein S26